MKVILIFQYLLAPRTIESIEPIGRYHLPDTTSRNAPISIAACRQTDPNNSLNLVDNTTKRGLENRKPVHTLLRAVDDTITVSVALLRSLLGSTRLSRPRLSRSLLLLSLTSASHTRSSNVVGVNVNGEVLKSITVDDALGRVGLGEFDGVGVVFGEVVDDILADGRDVEDAVEEISGPEGVELGLSDGVAETADGVEAAADLEGARADDGLGGGVVTSPVASPFYNC